MIDQIILGVLYYSSIIGLFIMGVCFVVYILRLFTKRGN